MIGTLFKVMSIEGDEVFISKITLKALQQLMWAYSTLRLPKDGNINCEMDADNNWLSIKSLE